MMKTDGPRKVIIKIATDEDQQQNARSARKTLKTLQQTATDKENLAGRPALKIDLEKKDVKRIKPSLMNKTTQTDKYAITTEDLTSDTPSEDYWQILAEKRGQALDESMREIEKLKDNIAALQEENKICKEMLEESKHLVEVLQEMLAENEEEGDDNAEDDA